MRAPGEIGERLACVTDEGVADITSGQNRGNAKAPRQFGRQVLHRMHGHINIAAQQRLVDLFGEQALAAELTQRLVLDAIAGSGDDAEPDIALAKPRGVEEACPDMARLPKCQRAATCAD